MSEEMNNQQDKVNADEKTEAARDENLKGDNAADTCDADVENTETAAKTGNDESAENAQDVGEASSDDGQSDGENSTSKDSKAARKDPKDAQIEELQDKYRRQMAEFDNFRKRSEKEKSAMYEIGARDIIEKILPIVDNFERGLESISDEEKATPFAEGIDKIYKQFTKALEDMGVKPIEALGKEFNPDLHNAVMHVDDEEAGDSIIVEEFQKGYTYRDSVVRHSMVKVAN